MHHSATTAGTMPAITPTLIEKLTLIRHREGLRNSDEFAAKIGLSGPTLRAYENGNRKPSKFVRLHLEKLVAAYEKGGLKAMFAAAKANN